jgi:hypothetical protein
MRLDVDVYKPEFLQSLKPAQAQNIWSVVVHPSVMIDIFLWRLKRPVWRAERIIRKEWLMRTL